MTQRCRLQQELMSLMVIHSTPSQSNTVIPCRYYFLLSFITHAHARTALAQSIIRIHQMSGDEGISAFPKDDNLFEWLGTIHGSTGTVYEGLEYKISLKFGPRYPNEPPQARAHPARLLPLPSSLRSTVQIHNARVSPQRRCTKRQHLPRYPHS